MRRLGPILLALSALGGGCDRREPSRDPEPPPGRREAIEARAAARERARLEREIEKLEADAGAGAIDPAPTAGDLKGEIDGFTTLDACVAARAVRDPLLGDAIDALGYDTLTRDACRTLEALKTKSRAPCAPIVASPLRERCESQVAALAGEPTLCPVRGASGRGAARDPVCLARANRDARLCAAALLSEQDLCRALVTGDRARCGRDGSCARQVDRWRPVLTAPSAHAPFTTHLSVEIHGAAGTADPEVTAFDLGDVSAAGAVVRKTAAGLELSVGSPRDATWLPWEAPLARPRAFVGAALVGKEALGAKIPIEAPRASFELVLPKVASLSSVTAQPGGVLEIGNVPTQVGGRCKVKGSATVSDGARAFEVKIDLDTFVRDVVEAK